MANKVYDMAFKLNAMVGQSFGTTFASAQQKLSQTQKKIAELNKVQADISAYQKQQQAIEATNAKLANYRKKLKNVEEASKEAKGFDKRLADQKADLMLKISDATRTLGAQEDALKKTNLRLAAAGVNTKSLTDEEKKLAAQTSELAKQAHSYGQKGTNAFESVGSALVASGIAAGLGKLYEKYKQCVSIAGDFEETMSAVEALSGASSAEMQSLADYAKELGAKTKFTAKESADAMTYMGMAGWNAEQMMSGMSGLLNLAAASGEDLALTADIVTDNLTAFGMQASETGRFSDVLAAAATNSNTSVSIMGETFKNCAPLAGALGYSVEDVAVAVGLMANAGTKGSSAGTALKNVFNGLLNGVTLTSAAFGEVEYSALNADGTMKSLGETLSELRSYFEQMTGAEKMQNAEALAGQRAMSGFVTLMNSTDADFQSLTTSINNSAGAAQKMADIRLDNLNGQLTLMNSAADALKTTVGEACNKELKGLAEIGTNILSGVNEFLAAHPFMLKSMIAMLAVGGSILVVYKSYIAVKKVKNTLTALETALTAQNSVAIGAEATATIGATAAQKGLNAAMKANPIGIIIAGATLLGTITAGLIDHFTEEQRAVEKLTTSLGEMNNVFESAESQYNSTTSEIAATAKIADEYISRLEEFETQGLATSEQQEEYRLTVDKLNAVMPDLNAQIDEQTGLLQGGASALRDCAEEWKKTALQEALQTKYKDEMKAYADAYVELQTNQEKYDKAVAQSAVLNDQLAKHMEPYNKLLQQRDQLIKNNTISMEAQNGSFRELYEAIHNYENDTAWLIGANEIRAKISESSKEQSALQKAIEKSQSEMEGANEKVKEAEKILDSYNDTLAETSDETHNHLGSISTITAETATKLSELKERYDELYTAAKQSIEGQYKLWDQADVVAATSAESTNNALSSQIAYWSDYKENIDTLTGKAKEIEGLSEMISTFADGSPESVNMIAGLAEATDEQIAEMVVSWKTLVEQQEETAKGLAEITDGISEEIQKAQQEYEAAVDGLDLSDESAKAAKDTVEAYAQAIRDGTADAVFAAEELAKQVTEAMTNAEITTQNNMLEFIRKTSPLESILPAITTPPVTPPGYASGTISATPGWHLVGENGPELEYFGGGERVYTAAETKSIFSGGTKNITIAPQFIVNGSMDEGLALEYAQTVRDMVMDALAEDDIDQRRGVYA